MICDRYPICGLVVVLLMSGCQSETGVVRDLNQRYYYIFSEAGMTDIKSGEPLHGVKNINRNGKMVAATQIQVNPDFAAKSVAIAQPIDIRQRHRFVDVFFPLRALSAPCTFQPAITVEGDHHSLYLYDEPLTLSHTNWVKCQLSFRNFIYNSTQLNLSIDRLHVVRWKKITLHLIFLKVPDSSFILEWGPVKLVRQHKRYHFD